MLRIARRAAELVLRVYGAPFEVELKGPGDPVTRADREANELICSALEAEFPGEPILAEESVPADPAEVARRASAERVWFVDPLDGTREFATRNDEFAVMIGRAARGRAELGVLVEPTTGDALIGRKASGGRGRVAVLERASGAAVPLTVSTAREGREARLLVSRSHPPEVASPFTERLGITRVVPCGSVGVKVARIARGEAELYVHGGHGAKKWDTCAPEAVLVAAGGAFTALDGSELAYGTPDLVQRGGICASNGALHEAALEAIAHVMRERGAEARDRKAPDA